MQILNLQMLSWTMVKYCTAPELDRQKVLFKVISPYLLSIFIPRDKIKQVVSKSRSAVCSRVYNLSKQECQGWTQRQSSSHKSIIHIAGKRWAKYQGAIKQVWSEFDGMMPTDSSARQTSSTELAVAGQGTSEKNTGTVLLQGVQQSR